MSKNDLLDVTARYNFLPEFNFTLMLMIRANLSAETVYVDTLKKKNEKNPTNIVVKLKYYIWKFKKHIQNSIVIVFIKKKLGLKYILLGNNV